jgi:hypothetical protein
MVAFVGFGVLTASTKIAVFGLYHRVEWYEFADVSEVYTASIFRAMSKPRVRNRLELKEPISHSRTSARPEGTTAPISYWLPGPQAMLTPFILGPTEVLP